MGFCVGLGMHYPIVNVSTRAYYTNSIVWPEVQNHLQHIKHCQNNQETGAAAESQHYLYIYLYL